MSYKEKKPCELGVHSACNGVNSDTLQTQYTINTDDLNSLLYEVNGDPKDRKSLNRSFANRKQYSDVLSSSFARLSLQFGHYRLDEGMDVHEIEDNYMLLSSLGPRSARVSNCGNTLEFRKLLNSSEPWKLHKAYFCRDRLCPMCIKRRSLKIFAQLSDIMNVIDKSNYEFLFLTLTVRNCEGHELREVCDKILKSFTKLTRRKEIKSIIKGYFRALEVTFNHNEKSNSYMTFHPHLHVILVVPKSYYKKSYITHDKWLQMWQECYGDNSIEFVNVKKIKIGNTDINKSLEVAFNKAVAEVGKYSVKSSDYLFPKNEYLTDYAVKYLSYSLSGLRLFALGGLFSDVSKSLNQEDVMSDNVDLININHDDVINPKLAYVVVRFGWGGSYYSALSVDLYKNDV